MTGALAGVQARTPDNAVQPTAASVPHLLAVLASLPILGAAEGERQGALTTEGYGA
jgi:hypothetical protein